MGETCASEVKKERNILIEDAIKHLTNALDTMDNTISTIQLGDVPTCVDKPQPDNPNRSIADLVNQLPEDLFGLTERVRKQTMRLQEMLY